MYEGAMDEPISFLLRFFIAVLVYVFGFVLLIRQFAGLYPEYFVTAGRTGLGMRKALYRNIVDIDEVSESAGETEIMVHMRTGESLSLTLPVPTKPVFYQAIKDNQPEL